MDRFDNPVDVEVAHDVEWHLIRRKTIQDSSQFIEELLLHRLRARAIHYDDDRGETSDDGSSKVLG